MDKEKQTNHKGLFYIGEVEITTKLIKNGLFYGFWIGIAIGIFYFALQ